MKKCGSCKEVLPLDMFRIHKWKDRQGPASYCRPCHSKSLQALKRKWRKTAEGYIKHLVTQSNN